MHRKMPGHIETEKTFSSRSPKTSRDTPIHLFDLKIHKNIRPFESDMPTTFFLEPRPYVFSRRKRFGRTKIENIRSKRRDRVGGAFERFSQKSRPLTPPYVRFRIRRFQEDFSSVFPTIRDYSHGLFNSSFVKTRQGFRLSSIRREN